MKLDFLRLFALGILLFAGYNLHAQLDTKHYVPPMFGREDHGDHYIVLSTPSTTPFDVTITDGTGNYITTVNISNASSSSYFLGSGNGTEFLVTEGQLNTALSNKGLILTGNYDFYVNVRVWADPQAGSLTSKGSKASLGQDFRTGHLFNNTGDSFRKSNVFSIMATEDNTTVNITDIRPGVIFRNTATTGGTSDDITVVLNEGECYVVAAFLDEPGAVENVNGVNGTRITSDKDIVVNSGTWLGGNALVGGNPAAGRDLGIDQIVPVDLIGDEYVVIKGEGIDNEKIIIIATQDNTDIALNGGATVATINAGDYHVVDVTSFTANENLYIQTSKKVYAYQTSNGGNGATDDNERQCGLNFLPPIGCSGSKQVVLPEVDFLGTAFINIIANTGSTITVDGVPLGAGDAVTGTPDYVTYKLPGPYNGDIEIVSDDLMRVALINLSGNVGASGYFSGFTKDVAVQTQTVNGDNIALEGCISASFDFSIGTPSTDDTEITYQVMGTATNGIDYEFIDTVLTIPAGQTSGTIFIHSIADGFPEGQETVYIIYQPDLCSPVDTAVLYIDDAQPIEFTLDGTDLACFEDSSGQIQVNASGGFPPYTFHVTDDAGNGSTFTTLDNPIMDLPADVYSVQVYDIYGCKADALVIGGIFDADTTFLPDGSGVSYESVINISGFQPGQTLDNMSQLQQVCMTMEHSYLGDLQIKVISPSGEEVILKQFNGGGSCDLGEPFASGPVDGANSNLTDPGVGYEYCFNASPIYGTMVGESNNYTHTIPASTGGTYTDNYLPAGSYTSFETMDQLLGCDLNGDWTLEVSDQFGLDNGYIFTWNVSLMSDLPDTLVHIEEPNEMTLDGFVTQANCGGNDGAIDLSIDGDYPPFTVLWSSGQNTEDISGIPAGIYTAYVTDDNGCTDSITFNLNNISSLNITSAITPVTCAGGNDGAINVSTSGGTSPYNFNWNTGPTTEDISGLTAGTYTLTITDDNGCQLTENIVVNSLPAITISLNNSTNEMCSQGNGAINVNVSGGTGSYGYSWDNGATTEDISGISAGTYYLTVTDASGCTAQNNFSILNDVSNCSAYCYTNIVVESVTDEMCGDGTGAIDISVMDATNPYNVSWSNGPITEDQTGLSAGTYTVTILDANQCEIVQQIVVGNDAGDLALSSSSVSNENCGNADGSIDITVIGGTPPYTYLWSNAATSEDVTGLSAGNYSVTITDNNGCSFVQDFDIINNSGTLSESAFLTHENCGNGGGAINLSVTGGVGPYTYSWSNGPTTQDIGGLSAGTYNVLITDNVGCSMLSQDYVVQNMSGDLQILSTNITNENCNDGAGAIDITVINGNAPYTYLWSNAANTEDITGLSQGIYSCTVTDNFGCSVSTGDLTVFNQAGTLEATTNSVVNEVCSDGTGAIDIDVTGGTMPYSYLWSNAATSEDISGLSEGTYTVEITDVNGCVYNHIEVVGNLSPGFSVSINSVTNESCGDGTGAIDINTSGGAAPINYNWSNGATSEDLNSLNAGSYNVIITDNNGCIVSTSAVVNGGGISINGASITDEICGDMGGAINIAFTGGQNPYNFNWSNGAISEDISGLSAGTYDLTITDLNGCMATASYAVGNNTNGLGILSTTVTDEDCGDGQGAIDVQITGGASPISYDWDSGQNTQDLSGLSAGSYNLTVMDANGCTVNTSGTVLNNSAGFTASINTITDENCGDGTGAIDIDVSGGMAPYTYLWSNASTSEDLATISAGDYEVTVTDDNGCAVILTATVNNITSGMDISNAVIGNASCANPSGFIDLTMNGSGAPYTYLWSTSATTQDVAGLSAGTYTCQITDNGGCVMNYQGEVLSSGGNISGTETITNEICSNGEGEINVLITGGIQPLTFSWDGAPPSTCCSYTINMYDSFGDGWNNGYITIYQDGSPSGNITLAGGNSGVETFDVCNGQALDFEWTPGGWPEEVTFEILDANNNVIYTQATQPSAGVFFSTTGACTATNETTLSGLSEGVYELTVTDNVGCQFVETYTVINEPSTVQINVNSVTNELCSQNNGEIIYSVSGGTAPYTTTANGFTDGPPIGTLSNLYEDNWELITVDNNGCRDTVNVMVANDATFTIDTVVTHETCNSFNGSIDVTITGGGVMDFAWSNGATTEDLSGLDEGIYTCTITDTDNGCVDEITIEITNVSDITVTESIVDENCGDAAGSIDLTITGSSDISIGWSNGASTEDISGLSAGNYAVSIINNTTGCLYENDYTIGNTTSGMTVFAGVLDENCGNEDGAININVTGGSGNYDYLWSNGETTANIFGLEAGDYTLTVTDLSDGCQYQETYTVLSDGNFNLDLVSVIDENCGDGTGSIDISATGPGTFNMTYDWSNGEITEDLSNLSEGVYSVDATNNFGCTMSLDVTVENFMDITVITSFVNENCSDGMGSIDLTVAGSTDLSYDWSNGATSQDISGLSAGTYSCTITNNTTGCQENIQVTIENVTTGVEILASGIIDENCGSGTGAINLIISGGVGPYSYQWSNGATTEDINGLNAGTYTVTITDDNDGCFITDDFVVDNDGSNLTVNLISVLDENCGDEGGAIDLDINGSANYIIQWSNGAGTEDISGLSAGTYECIIYDQDNANCMDVVNVEIENITSGIEISDLVATDENCGDGTGTIDLTVAGGVGPYSYSWNNGETTEDLTGLNAGIYEVTVTDDNDGCQVVGTIEVNNTSSGVQISNAAVNGEFCGDGNGFIDIVVTGGVGPYAYSWSNGEMTEDINGLSEGTYIVTVTDLSDGCQITASYVVQNMNDMTVTYTTTDENCGDETGAIDLSVTGSTDLSFSWSNGASTEDLTGIAAGSYTCNITNNTTGCMDMVIVEVGNVSSGVEIAGFNVLDDNCGTETGTIDITVSGGTGPYTYAWNNGATTEDVSGLGAGTYTVTVTDNGDGCQISQIFEVGNTSSGVELTGVSITDEDCGDGMGAINITVSGGVGPYSYEWSNGATTEDITGLTAGNYSVIITDDADGCQITYDYDVDNNATFSVSGTVQNASCVTCPTGWIDITINEQLADGPYSFAWSNGATTEDISDLIPGIYTVTVTSNSGCIVIMEFEVGDNHDVGIAETSNNWSLSIYPNPANAIFNIAYDFGSDEQVVLVMTSITGELVYSTEINNSIGILEIASTDFASGVYYLQFTNGTQNKTVRLIISR